MLPEAPMTRTRWPVNHGGGPAARAASIRETEATPFGVRLSLVSSVLRQRRRFGQALAASGIGIFLRATKRARIDLR